MRLGSSIVPAPSTVTLVRSERIYGDRASSFGVVLVPLSRLNKPPLQRYAVVLDLGLIACLAPSWRVLRDPSRSSERRRSRGDPTALTTAVGSKKEGRGFTACCSGSEPMRTWQHERLLSRPKTKDSLLGRRRHVKGPGCPHLLRGPLLGQALRREGRAGRAFGPEEASRLSPEAGREGHQALGGGFQ